MKADVKAEVKNAIGSAGLTDAQLELRLRELELRLEKQVDTTLNKALVALSAKIERLLEPLRLQPAHLTQVELDLSA